MVRMLLVEDNKHFRTSLREALNLRFPALELQEADDAGEALRSLRAAPPELTLLDLSLPDGSGLDLAARILSEWPELRVGICTSYDLPEYREAAACLGVSSFLVKQALDWEAFAAFVNSSSLSRRPAAPG